MDLFDELLNPAWPVFARIRTELIEKGEDERAIAQWLAQWNELVLFNTQEA